MTLRPNANGMFRKNDVPGRAVGMVSLPRSVSIVSAVILSRWSTDRALHLTPTSTPPEDANSSACILPRMPYFSPVSRMRAVSSGVKKPVSQNTSIYSAKFSLATAGIISRITKSTYSLCLPAYSRETACAPKKVATTLSDVVSLMRLMTRNIFSSSAVFKPYPLLISMHPVPFRMTSSTRCIACWYSSSSDMSCNLSAELRMPPPRLAISA